MRECGCGEEGHRLECPSHRFNGHFPTNPEEARAWSPYQRNHALAMTVLAVAHTRVEGAWCAYINSVPGMNHRAEEQAVLDNGEKLGEEIALALFPELRGVPYAR